MIVRTGDLLVSTPDLVMRLKESSKSKKGYSYSVEAIDHGDLDGDIKLMNDTGEYIDDFRMKLSNQYNRVHGITGMESCVGHGIGRGISGFGK